MMTDFLKKIISCTREDIDKIIKEKTKPVKLIPIIWRNK